MNQEEVGGYVAATVGELIVMQGDAWNEPCFTVQDATRLYSSGALAPEHVRLFPRVEQVLAAA